MMMDIIKVKAYALIRRGRDILAEPIHTAEGTLIGYRPLGGSVEFGEKVVDAIKREFMEELSEEIIVNDLFCISEDVFEFDNHVAHENAFIYEAEFVNKDLYNQDQIERVDTVHNIPIHAFWLDPMNVPNGLPLWPDYMLTKLKRG